MSYQNEELIVDSASGADPPEDDEDDEATKGSLCTWQKALVGGTLVAFIIYVIVDATTTKNLQTISRNFLVWVQDNPAPGVFAFMGVYFIATVLFIPGSILTLGSGFVFSVVFGLGWGVFLATVAVFVGAGLGAVVAFLLGRYLLQEQVEKLAKKYPVFEAIDKALADKGLFIFVLLRLSPIIPFNALNYLGGATAVSFWAYTTALIAILPGTVFYIFLGSSAGSLVDIEGSNMMENGEDEQGNGNAQTISIVVGIIFGILGIAVTSIYAKKELNKIIGERAKNGDVEENVQ
mmetsp:Transcript_1140/g.2276  ORF Transcript_1140/g.2276 Transcript_1140/m.2276 type:complete len:292 (-) Transcript_1140:437-1312(-)|eukprot:CAMPEP_0113308506 /NCGR_PEP_ID=MMETSP0010_2-20120614/6923_1 /TAXON_ID=216773 ORGANISM="Corethron hystrix, Strain 308" /NCGR_SAMPLE_ID=MMETSP0010_2 /ASSEMBLY_ACC=CAM_ASM_000155 /LENGTH=291 /DNA_ID=CAMNT_0000163573 /DNA_START=135 /DNA_END=1010 /DNA_ORIENTATION=- /assembly_acc=CAM_ASM_000155